MKYSDEFIRIHRIQYVLVILGGNLYHELYKYSIEAPNRTNMFYKSVTCLQKIIIEEKKLY